MSLLDGRSAARRGSLLLTLPKYKQVPLGWGGVAWAGRGVRLRVGEVEMGFQEPVVAGVLLAVLMD